MLQPPALGARRWTEIVMFLIDWRDCAVLYRYFGGRFWMEKFDLFLNGGDRKSVV